MTNLATLHAIAALYNQAAAEALTCDVRARNAFADGTKASAHAADFRAQAHEYAAIMRQIDPDHAADHAGPQPWPPRVAAELHTLATLLLNVEPPAAGSGTHIEVHLHEVDPDRARDFAERAAKTCGARIVDGSMSLLVKYGEHPMTTTIALYLRKPAQAVPAVVEEHQAPTPDSAEVPGQQIASHVDSQLADLGASLDDSIELADQLVADLAADVDPLAETAPHPIRPRPSRDEAPVQVGDRVLIRRDEETEAQGLKPYPAELEGCTGTVTEVDAHAFIENPDRGELDDPPIVVQVDGVTATHCFAVAELEVSIRIEDAEQAAAVDAVAGQCV